MMLWWAPEGKAWWRPFSGWVRPSLPVSLSNHEGHHERDTEHPHEWETGWQSSIWGPPRGWHQEDKGRISLEKNTWIFFWAWRKGCSQRRRRIWKLPWEKSSPGGLLFLVKEVTWAASERGVGRGELATYVQTFRKDLKGIHRMVNLGGVEGYFNCFFVHTSFSKFSKINFSFHFWIVSS